MSFLRMKTGHWSKVFQYVSHMIGFFSNGVHNETPYIIVESYYQTRAATEVGNQGNATLELLWSSQDIQRSAKSSADSPFLGKTLWWPHGLGLCFGYRCTGIDLSIHVCRTCGVVSNVRVCARCAPFVFGVYHTCVHVYLVCCLALRKKALWYGAKNPRCVCAWVRGALRGCSMCDNVRAVCGVARVWCELAKSMFWGVICVYARCGALIYDIDIALLLLKMCPVFNQLASTSSTH